MKSELLIPEKAGLEFKGWYFDTTGSNGTGAQCIRFDGENDRKME